MEWIRQAWELFKRNPGIWIGIVVLWIVISGVLGAMPLLGLVTNLFTPVVMGGLMQACRRQAEGGDVSLDALFEGFRSPALSKLILLGVLQLVGGAVIALLVGGSLIAVIGGGMMMGSGHYGASVLGAGGLLAVLFALLLIVPLTMALWFAPALVVFRQMDPVEAIKVSFHGCLQNVWPLTVYSLLALVLLIAGIIPLGLGLLVVIPVLLISIYTSYREIYPG